jgi:hypothetical protein
VITVGKEGWPVKMLTISKGGLSFASTTWIAPGSLLNVRIHNTAMDYLAQLPVRVVYSMATDENQFVVGACFTRELDSAEVRGLL